MTRTTRRVLLGGAAALAAGTLFVPRIRDGAKDQLRARLFPEAWRPAPSGPDAVGRTTLALPIGGADGAVTVDVWYPAAPAASGPAPRDLLHPALAPAWHDAPFAAASGPAPVILYQPSWFSHRRESSFMLANLASHGFVVLAMDDIRRYPGADGEEAALRGAVLDMGSEAAMEASMPLVAGRVALAARIGAATLDAFAADAAWASRIDPSRVAVLGFSFGGAIAAEMVRAQPRVTAGINLDGSTYGPAGEEGVGRPFLTLFGDTPFPPLAQRTHPDPAIRLEAVLTQLESERQLARADTPGTWCFSVEAARHGDFSDALVVPPITSFGETRDIDRLAMWGAINAPVLDFLDQQLRGGDGAVLRGPLPPGLRRLHDLQAHAISALPPTR